MKKVMIAMLALAVVFGFAACDNQNGLTNRSVDYITINQLADFAEGQAFDASKYEVVAHNTDGTETKIDGLGLVEAVLDEGVWNGAVKASLTTANLAAEQELTATYQTVFKKVTNISFNGITLAVEEGASLQNSDYTGIPTAIVADGTLSDITFAYDGGSVSIPATSYKDASFMYSFYDAEEEKYVTTAGEAGDVYDVYIGWYCIDKDVIANPAVATNLKVTVVEKGAAATFDRYEFDVTSPAIAGEPYVWKLYEVDSKNVKTEVASSTDWASTSSKNFVVASYDDGNAATKDDEFKSMPATNTLFDQTVTIYSKAYSNRGPIELKFPAGENYITAMPEKTAVAFAEGVTQDAVKKAALSPEDLAIKITKQINDSEDGETQQYLESGYSIIKQECDGSNWKGLVSVTINTKDTVGGVNKIVEKSTILEVELAVNTAKNN